LTVETTWSKINNALRKGSMEIATVPSDNRTPLWFTTYIEKDVLYVDKAKVHAPSSKMSAPRRISQKDFNFVYSYYSRWANGETYLRHEVSRLSRNVAYIFALISRFE